LIQGLKGIKLGRYKQSVLSGEEEELCPDIDPDGDTYMAN